jgi:hypothetical protein
VRIDRERIGIHRKQKMIAHYEIARTRRNVECAVVLQLNQDRETRGRAGLPVRPLLPNQAT